MNTTENIKVYKDLPYNVSVKANGIYDYSTSKTFTTEGESLTIPSTAFTVYDGLSYNNVPSYNSADQIDFSNTVLPDYAHLDSGGFNSCLMPTNKVYNNIITAQKIPANFKISGELSVSDENVASNFTSSNFIILQDIFNPGSNPWEMVFKVKTGPSLPTTPGRWFVGSGDIAGGSSGYTGGGDYQGVAFGLGDNSSAITFYLSSNGSSWDIASYATGTTTLLANNWYYFKLEFTGTAYNSYVSTDGENWSIEKTIESSTPVFVSAYPLCIGGNFYTPANPASWPGSIDLSESYIKINNQMWWKPEFTQGQKITVKNSVSQGFMNFDTANNSVQFQWPAYLKSSATFAPAQATTSWQIRAKITTGDTLNDYISIINSPLSENVTGGYTGVRVVVRNKTTWDYLVAKDANSWIKMSGYQGNYPIAPNTTYYIIAEYDGAYYQYYLKVSTDGENFTTVVNYSSSYKVYGEPWFGGGGDYSLDLNWSQFIVAGDTFWQPELDTGMVNLPGCTYNYTDDGSATTLNCFAHYEDGATGIYLTPDNYYPIHKDALSGYIYTSWVYLDISTTDNWEDEEGYISQDISPENVTTYGDPVSGNVLVPSLRDFVVTKQEFNPGTHFWTVHLLFRIAEDSVEQIIAQGDGFVFGVNEDNHFFARFYDANGEIGECIVNDYTVQLNTWTDVGVFYDTVPSGSWTYYAVAGKYGEEGFPSNDIISTRKILPSKVTFGCGYDKSSFQKLGTVSIPAHDVYEYEDGTWTEANNE